MTIQEPGSRAAPMSNPASPVSKAYFDTRLPGIFAFRLGNRGLILLLIAAVAAGVALDWKWLVAVGVAPLILSVLPCAAMCAIGLCAMGGRDSSCAKKPDAPGNNQVPRDQSADPSATQLTD